MWEHMNYFPGIAVKISILNRPKRKQAEMVTERDTQQSYTLKQTLCIKNTKQHAISLPVCTRKYCSFAIYVGVAE